LEEAVILLLCGVGCRLKSDTRFSLQREAATMASIMATFLNKMSQAGNLLAGVLEIFSLTLGRYADYSLEVFV
jgi:hypothetical protein